MVGDNFEFRNSQIAQTALKIFFYKQQEISQVASVQGALMQETEGRYKGGARCTDASFILPLGFHFSLGLIFPSLPNQNICPCSASSGCRLGGGDKAGAKVSSAERSGPFLHHRSALSAQRFL